MRFISITLAFLLLALAAAVLVVDTGATPAQLAPYVSPYVATARPLAPWAVAGLAFLLFVVLLFYRPGAAPA